MRHLLFFGVIILALQGCAGTTASNAGPLPVLGEPKEVNGEMVQHQIRDFIFVNQDSQRVTNATFAGKAYVVDFFFISCPTICPKLTKQMLRIHDRFDDEDRLLLLSHSIDTKYDTIPRLKAYAENLGVSSDKWHFVTGEKDDIFSITEDYFSVAFEDGEAPGGYDHTGYIVLVDPDGHVRAYANGTDPESVGDFLNDIDRLMAEMDQEL
ncbi:MAG TPA: SCO family protein [Saprospiraceae bacterium]|nr:SCO family protein [Saprospiraceae bacterium]